MYATCKADNTGGYVLHIAVLLATYDVDEHCVLRNDKAE